MKTLRVQGRTAWEILHLDTAGPFNLGLGRIRYFLVAVCDYSGFISASVVKNKKEIVQVLTQELLRIQQLANKTIKGLFTDNGTEFLNTKMEQFLWKNNMFMQGRSPNFPSENGKAERAIRSIKTMARSLILTSKLDNRFWGFAVLYAAEILNVLPRKNEACSPFEKLFGFTPDYTRFKIFGCKGHALTPSRQTFKGYPTMIFLGFNRFNKTYVVWMIKENKVRTFRDISVLEKECLMRERKQFVRETPKITPTDTRKKRQVPSSTVVELEEEYRPEIPPTTPKTTSNQPNNTTQNEEIQIVDADTSESDEEKELKNFCDINPNNILDTDRRGNTVNYLTLDYGMEFWTSLVGEDAQEVYAYSLKVQDELKPPRRWYEIQHRNDKQQWIEAYQKEVNSLEKVGGMVVVPHPRKEEVLELLEIFSWKENTFSGKREAKVRMAGRGDKARIKLSMYSPVGGATGMRLLIHTATTIFDQLLRASDIKTAFLNARINKARYFHVPDGHVKIKGKEFVWKTYCALYGLTART